MSYPTATKGDTMSIARNSRSGKLVLPDITGTSSQKDIAWLYEEAGFPVHPWIRTKTKVSARKGRGFFNSPDVIESADDIDLWAGRWQCGFACSWRTGLIVLDVDSPPEFDDWDIGVPDTAQVATGREGGYHLYLDFRHLRAVVPQEEWPVQGDIPGGTLKSNGFVAAPGSRHPAGKLYRVISEDATVARGSIELLRALAEYRGRRRTAVTGSPGQIGELRTRALTAGEGEQHEAVLALVNALEKMASREAIEMFAFPELLRSLPSYDPRNPWTLNGLREMLGSAQAIYTTAEEERLLEEIARMEPNLEGEEGEDAFWNSREDLVKIRQWAQAQMVGPWALLGEILAEVVARVPPTFVLPNIIAGYGTLNMLLAITGDSGAGKGGAAGVARTALVIDEPKGPDGLPFNSFMTPRRIPVGSGEGLLRNYGHTEKGETVQHAFTSIPTAYEIDTLQAIMGRGSETISSQLRSFYTGEQLGFGYTSMDKRIFIPEYKYRGVFVAGVQPERSGVIVHDTSSGFAQRWMFLDATDPWAPDDLPPKPEPVKWSIPRGLYELDHDAGVPLEVAEVCDVAVAEIRAARMESRKGRGDRTQSHRLYTQEKFALALALLDMRTAIGDEDWKLAEYAMRRSDELRERCLRELKRQKNRQAREEGHYQGIKDVASEETKSRSAESKTWRTVFKHIPVDGRISFGKLSNKVPHLRKELPVILAGMANAKLIIIKKGSYRGHAATWYSRARKGQETS